MGRLSSIKRPCILLLSQTPARGIRRQWPVEFEPFASESALDERRRKDKEAAISGDQSAVGDLMIYCVEQGIIGTGPTSSAAPSAQELRELLPRPIGVIPNK